MYEYNPLIIRSISKEYCKNSVKNFFAIFVLCYKYIFRM